MGLGVGPPPITKIKGFYKNAINWYQKKTQGRWKMEAKRVKGQGRTRPPTTGAGDPVGAEGVQEVGTVIQSA